MESIFSHLPRESPEQKEGAAPSSLTAAVEVPRGVDEAFAGFTDGIHLWWPLEQTEFGDGTHPEFTDGQLVEESPSGEIASWATVVLSPPGTLELEWFLGGKPDQRSSVHITFSPLPAGTQVELEHSGWAGGSEGASQSAAAPDWTVVLARYRRFMGGAQ